MAAKSRLILLNIALVVGLVLIIWQGRVRWSQAEAERRVTVNIPVKKVTPPPVTPSPKPEPVQAAKYGDVAQKNLFSKDRNPTVILDEPKIEPPKVMPPLPVVYGVMGLPSGMKAIMSERAGTASRSVHVGDTVGEFKIVALDTRTITFEWDGKPLQKNIEDLKDHTGAQAAAQAGTPSGPAAPPPPPATTAPSAASLGADSGSGARACKAGDNSPVGTVVDGYKKVGTPSPFGIFNCSWVPDK